MTSSDVAMLAANYVGEAMNMAEDDPMRDVILVSVERAILESEMRVMKCRMHYKYVLTSLAILMVCMSMTLLPLPYLQVGSILLFALIGINVTIFYLTEWVFGMSRR